MNSNIDSLLLMTSGSCLLFHSRLSGLGRDSVQVLLDYFRIVENRRTSSVLVPAFNWRLLGSQVDPMPFTLENDRDSCTGFLPRLLIQHRLGERTLHPSHSFIVVGDRSPVSLLNGCLSFPTITPFAPAVFGLFLEKYAPKSLLLNLGPEYISSLHVAEELVSPDYYLDPSREIQVRYENRVRNFHIRFHKRIPRDFSIFFDSLQLGSEARSTIFGKKVYFLESNMLVSAYANKLKNDLCT